MATKQAHNKRVLDMWNRFQRFQTHMENNVRDRNNNNSNDLSILQRLCGPTWSGYILATISLLPNRIIHVTSKDPKVFIHMDLDANSKSRMLNRIPSGRSRVDPRAYYFGSIIRTVSIRILSS